MGVWFPPSCGAGELLPPPPPNDPRWHQRDRFGLPVRPPTLLKSDEEIALATDMFNVAVTWLGEPKAQRSLAERAKSPRRKGKQPDRDWNHQLLEMYDKAVREETDLIKSVPRRLARQLHPENPGSVPATEKRIRRLVKERSRRQRAMEAAYRRFPRSLLDEASSSDRDI